MRRAASFVLLAIYAVLTFGCGNSSSNGMLNNPVSPQVRVVQGATDTGDVDVLINGKKVAQPSNPLITPLYSAVSGASIHFEEVPAGTTGPALVDATYPVAANSFNSVMVLGRETNGSLASIALVDDHAAPPSGQIKVRLVHGSSTIGPLDVYISAIGSALPATPTIANLTFKTATNYLPFTKANFQVCMVPAGTSPSGGFIGGGPSQCTLNLIMNVSSSDENLTFAIFDPAILSGGNPGQFTTPARLVVLTDLKK